MKNKDIKIGIAQKAMEEKDAKWEAVHGINRDEHQRLLLAGFEDEWMCNQDWIRHMKLKKNMEVKK